MDLWVVWFAAMGCGGVAALVAIVVPSARRPALLVAGAAFAVAGVLGILSVGIFFIFLAVICLRMANATPTGEPPGKRAQ